jgi:hypothetical protein
MRITASQIFYLCVLVGVVCLELWFIHYDAGERFKQGLVLDNVSNSAIPASVSRWCFVKEKNPLAMTPHIAIIEFGTAKQRRRYAFPQPPGVALAINDEIWSDIDSCAVARIVKAPSQHAAAPDR